MRSLCKDSCLLQLALLAIALFLTPSCCRGATATETDVQLEGVWGKLNLQAGSDPLEIICSVYSPAPTGEIVWMIGDDVQSNNNPREDTADGDWQQSFNLIPSVENDGKKFRCIYIHRDDNGAITSDTEDSVELEIGWSDLPSGTVNAGSYYRGAPIELEVEFGLYPEPNNEAIVWEITDENNNVLRLEPEQSDGSYHTGSMSNDGLGANRYRTSLLISTVDLDATSEMDKKHVLVIRVSDSEVRIPVTFSLVEDPGGNEPSNPIQDDTKLASEETTEMPDTSQATLSVGMFIIIAIVILIILICIGYCIYQQCFRNRHNSGSGTGGGQGSFDGGSGSSRPTYKEVAKKDEEANMV